MIFAALITVLMVLCLSCGDDKPNGPQPDFQSLQAPNGLYYLGVMEDSTFNKAPEFTVVDKEGAPLTNQQIQVELIAGDGTLAPKSIVTDSTGIATLSYTFSGNLGYAVVRLTAPDNDSLDVYLRADVIRTGVHGQVQYIQFDDTYADVKNILGEPESVDIIPDNVAPDHKIIYVVYENSLGIVVMVADEDLDKKIYDTSSVYGVIMNTVYDTKTDDSIPIGVKSSFADVRAVYGAPSRILRDPLSPGDIRIDYDTLGARFYSDSTPLVDTSFTVRDTIIVELHWTEGVSFDGNPPISGRKEPADIISAAPGSRCYHLHSSPNATGDRFNVIAP